VLGLETPSPRFRSTRSRPSTNRTGLQVVSGLERSPAAVRLPPQLSSWGMAPSAFVSASILRGKCIAREGQDCRLVQFGLPSRIWRAAKRHLDHKF